MSNISSLSAFLKVDPFKRWGCATSPVRSPAERAAVEIQTMVRRLNLRRPKITAERYLDLARYIHELRWASDGISPRLARELVCILNREWTRTEALTEAQAQQRKVRRG